MKGDAEGMDTVHRYTQFDSIHEGCKENYQCGFTSTMGLSVLYLEEAPKRGIFVFCFVLVGLGVRF